MPEADLGIIMRARDEATAAVATFNKALGSGMTDAAEQASHALSGLGDATTAPLRGIGSLVDGLGRLGLAAMGVKAVAEIPLDGVGPVVANAFYDATGEQVQTLPLTPDRVWRALHAAKK